MGLLFSHLSLPEILKLERVQRRAKKFTPKTKGDYEVRIFKLNLLSPEHRRFLFDLLVLFFIKLCLHMSNSTLILLGTL